MEAITPEMDPVGFWSPKSRSFSSRNSIVVEEAARNFRSPRPSINKSREANSCIQHDKVEASKLHRYLETCSRALEQFLQRQTSSNDYIIFLFSMPLDQLVRVAHHYVSVRSRFTSPPTPLLHNIAETNRHAICSILVYRT